MVYIHPHAVLSTPSLSGATILFLPGANARLYFNGACLLRMHFMRKRIGPAMTSSVLSSRDDFADHLDAPDLAKSESHSGASSEEPLDLNQATALQNAVDQHVAAETQPADYAGYHDQGASGDDEDHMDHFSHSGGGSQIVSLNNGVAPASDFAFDASYTHPSAGLSQSQEDLDLDPAALLESLANFEHPPSNSEHNIPISNDHFASLLQAAASAGGQENTQQNHGAVRKSTRHSTSREDLLSGFQQKRKRIDTSNNATGTQGFLVSNVKRKKADGLEADEEAHLAREREIWGSEEQNEDGDSSIFEPIPGNHAFHPVTAGVHSAAALFRKPTNSAKKYTRPPMSKMFLSLQLSAENFLRLQAAAKAYMLDPEYPERKDCVGNRGGGDGTMVRLRLFNCVKYFMEDLGWGEKCWGPDAEGAAYRTLNWPKTSNKIISAATPLLRRIVTNERQRLYALETRNNARALCPKSKSCAKARKGQEASKTPPEVMLTPDQESELPRPDIDPKLNQYHYSLGPSFAASTNAEPESHNGSTNVELSPQVAKTEIPSQPSAELANGETHLKYTLNTVQDDRRVRDPVALTPASCPDYQTLVQHAHNVINDSSALLDTIQVLTQDGMHDVNSDESWQAAVELVESSDWMAGDVKVVVSVLLPN